VEDFASSFDADSLIEGIITALVATTDVFEEHGFDALKTEWEAMHAHAGQRLRVRLADGRSITGIAAGLADDGALSLLTRAGPRAIRSGRVVSARAA
jgi:biotin-(acetyl-CoA carboxylase) ligase